MNRTSSRALLVTALLLAAVNLRPAMSSLGPVLPEAMRDTGLTPATAGLLTTLPVLCLGLFGLAAPWFARRWGAERTAVVFFLVLALGLAVRVSSNAAVLVFGCALGGLAIGIINVLLPSIIKREFPDRMSLMMGVYSMGISTGAAIGAAVSAPLEQVFGGHWGLALAVWAVPALLAALVWAPLRGPHVRVAASAGGGLWRDPLAWQVTLYFSMAAALAYAIFAWLAPMLRARGLSAVEAGLVVSVCILIQAPCALIGPTLARLGKDQRLVGAVVFAASIIGLAGCLMAPLWSIWLWVAILGFGQGATFGIALILILLRAPDATATARLSAMTQGVGYAIGSTGPLVMGVLRGVSHGWTLPSFAFFGLGLVGMAAALGAGRSLHVTPAPVPANPAAPDPAAPGAA